MRVIEKNILDEASLASSTQTASLDMEHMVGVSVQVSASAGTGSATLEASNDGSTWFALPNAVTISGATSDMLYSTDFWYKWVRVNVNVSAAMSDVKLHITAKGM